jgi:hypothetical protein
MNNIDYIGADELVFNNNPSEEIYSGGFSVNSVMMKAGLSPIMTLNNQLGGSSNNVSDLFDNLVIPNWCISYDNKFHGGTKNEKNEKYDNEDSDEEIEEDLHEKLLGLVKEHENKLHKFKKKRTKRNKIYKEKGGTKRKK